ncbi:MAG: ATP-binding protein, partial [Clostridia bacterium]|nr:ATP-binding protein [Clostridia bacterium]
QYIKKIEEAVMFYDAAAKTGNNVLDVILTEKSLLFERNNITFTCVVRGEDLSFMDEMDIYSLFGNALSNAFEKVSLIKDADRRCISLSVRKEGESLSVHMENFYDGEILFEDGLPATNKNKDYHGYGIKSMDFIARKYNGYMNITTDDGIFCVDFVFPLKRVIK